MSTGLEIFLVFGVWCIALQLTLLNVNLARFRDAAREALDAGIKEQGGN